MQHGEVLLWRQLEQLQQHMYVAESNKYVTQVSLSSKHVYVQCQEKKCLF